MITLSKIKNLKTQVTANCFEDVAFSCCCCWCCQTPTRLGTQPERTWKNLNKSGSELTLFSHVTTRTTSPNFTLQEGSIGLYLREGESVGVLKVSGGCLEGVWKVFERCLEGIWKVSGRCLEGVWKVYERCMEGISKVLMLWDPYFFRNQNFFKASNFFQDPKFFMTN